MRHIICLRGYATLREVQHRRRRYRRLVHVNNMGKDIIYVHNLHY